MITRIVKMTFQEDKIADFQQLFESQHTKSNLLKVAKMWCFIRIFMISRFFSLIAIGIMKKRWKLTGIPIFSSRYGNLLKPCLAIALPPGV